MTATQVIAFVRAQNRDDKPNVEAQTWGDEKYVRVLNEGMRHIWTNYPESRLSATGAANTFVECSEVNLDATLVLPDTYLNALVDWCLYRYFDTDGGDTRDFDLAKKHFERFLFNFTPQRG